MQKRNWYGALEIACVFLMFSIVLQLDTKSAELSKMMLYSLQQARAYLYEFTVCVVQGGNGVNCKQLEDHRNTKL